MSQNGQIIVLHTLQKVLSYTEDNIPSAKEDNNSGKIASLLIICALRLST